MEKGREIYYLEAKGEYEKQRREEGEKLHTAKEVRQFYQNTNSIQKEFKLNSLLCKGKRGNITTETVDILEIWAQHFE
jgi:hypothetical protein